MHYNQTHMDIKRPCISISWLSLMFVTYYALPAEWIVPSSPAVGEGRSSHTCEIGEINISNYVIVSHKLGHCDLVSYKSLIKASYNSHDQLYIFLYFVVPNNLILLEISGFHMFLQNEIYFRFSYRAQPGASDFFLFNNLSYHPC